MPKRDNAVFWVESPVEFRIEGKAVIAEVCSGDWTINLAMPIPSFLGSVAKAGLVSSEIRQGAKIVQLRQAR